MAEKISAPGRIWAQMQPYRGLMTWYSHGASGGIEYVRRDLCASGQQVRPATIAHVVAEMMERAGEPRPNGDILADVLCQVLPAALTPAPQPLTAGQMVRSAILWGDHG